MKIITVLLALGVSTLAAQTPAFEVASIKPASPDQMQASRQAGPMAQRVTIDKNRVEMRIQSLSDILARAYDVVPVQIVGPDFLKTDRFDILAKMPEGGTEEQIPQMLQALLAERFKMTAHREKKEIAIYALVVGKGGPNPKRMKPATAEEMAPEPMPGDRTENTPFGKAIIRQTSNNGMVLFIPGMGTLKMSQGPNGIHIEMSNMTTARFAQLLSSDNDRFVVDKTGLKGAWEASFDISMDAMQQRPPGGGEGGGAPGASTPALDPIFAAMEQMGLKLEPQKDLVDMLVIDHIEKMPTAN